MGDLNRAAHKVPNIQRPLNYQGILQTDMTSNYRQLHNMWIHFHNFSFHDFSPLFS